MALYRLSSKIGKSGTATSHYNYIAREGKYQRGTKKEDLIYKESKNLPSWANEKAALFWKECEENYRKIELALPLELSSRDQVILTRKFCDETFGNDFVYSFAIHENVGVLSGKRNPHAHILFSERKIERNRPEPNRENWFKKSRTRKDGTISGGYRKDKTITGTNRKNWLLNIRKRWETLQNNALMITGSREKVDCRRKVEYAPESLIPAQIHLGAKRARMRAGEVWNEYQAIKAMPAVVAELERASIQERSKTQKLAEITALTEKVSDELGKAIEAELKAKKEREEALKREQAELERKRQELEIRRAAAEKRQKVLAALYTYPETEIEPEGKYWGITLTNTDGLARIYENGVVSMIDGQKFEIIDIMEHADNTDEFGLQGYVWTATNGIAGEAWRASLERRRENEQKMLKVEPEIVPVEPPEATQSLVEQGKTAYTKVLPEDKQELKTANSDDEKIEIKEKSPKIEPEQEKVAFPALSKRSAGSMLSSSRDVATGETTTLYTNGTVRIAGELYEIADIGEIKGAEHGILGTKYEVRLPNGVTFKVNEKVWAQSKQAAKGLDKGRGGFSL